MVLSLLFPAYKPVWLSYWYYHWLGANKYVSMVWQSHQVPQTQPICVDNNDAHSWITGWKDIQNSFKRLQRHTIDPTNNMDLTFTVLQLIWVSTSQSYKYLDVTNDFALNFTVLQISGCYKWSCSQFHNPINHLDPTFTRPCSQHIYEICESKTAYES
jgi:hypothetical protein